MNLTIESGVPMLTVFIQGLLSFFSPCVLPLVPLYISYLAGGAQKIDENGKITYPRKKVLINTIFFIVGISFTFFLLALGFSALGRFFRGNQIWFVRVSGIIMVLFGLYQLGFLGKANSLERERRLPFQLDRWAMNPLVALLLGFTFSFAWTPCVGPTLASVLLMASTSASRGTGFLLIGIYMLGFVLPFLGVGFFTSAVLGFFRKHQSVVKYTVKIGGALLILMGIMTLTGWMNGITGYLSSIQGGISSQVKEETQNTETTAATEQISEDTSSKETTTKEIPVIPAPDFTLVDQFGVEHTLSDYKGKTVFLNFWATWCGPCQIEMPDIQELYEEYDKNQGDLIILGIANPKTEEHPNNSDVTQEKIEQFLEDNGFDYPVVMDTTSEIFQQYGIMAFPTTFMIDTDGNIFGYVTGTLTKDMMQDIIDQTMSGKRK